MLRGQWANFPGKTAEGQWCTSWGGDPRGSPREEFLPSPGGKGKAPLTSRAPLGKRGPRPARETPVLALHLCVATGTSGSQVKAQTPPGKPLEAQSCA